MRTKRIYMGLEPLKGFFLSAACVCLSLLTSLHAGDDKNPPHLSSKTRMELIHVFGSELVYIRTIFPMGTKGLTLKDGVLSPSGVDLEQMIVTWGPSVKPGDQARITGIIFKDNLIRFEINGGPVKKQKWYQHISVGGMGGETPIAPTDSSANPRGSYLDLVFDKYVPEIDGPQLRALLRPVFDFNAKSAEEAYLDTLPPKVKSAIQEHKVLVGMDRQMVIYAKGRAPKKTREKDGDTEFEDWIYGEPPQDVDFVRIVGDEVVRVETMTVAGVKTIRTAREVDIAKPKPDTSPVENHPASVPTLRRPGEQMPDETSPGTKNTTPSIPPPTFHAEFFREIAA